MHGTYSPRKLLLLILFLLITLGAMAWFAITGLREGRSGSPATPDRLSRPAP